MNHHIFYVIFIAYQILIISRSIISINVIIRLECNNIHIIMIYNINNISTINNISSILILFQLVYTRFGFMIKSEMSWSRYYLSIGQI